MQHEAATRAQIPPFYVMQALSEAEVLARQGQSIVHLSLGQPSAAPPQRVKQVVAEKALSDKLGYTESAGMRPLRERIAGHYRAQYGLNIDPERIFITVGSSAAYMLALLCAFDAGQEVALAAPHYPASPNMMEALGLEPALLQTHAAENYQPTVDLLKGLERSPHGLVIASPSNPAGTVIHPQTLKALTQHCEANEIRIISDEIYHGITFGEAKAETVLRFSDQMIVTNSFSKYYLLPGWRLGWCVLPDALIDAAHALLQNFYISPPTLAQYAALEVMECRDELDKVAAGYDENRRYLLEALPKAGFDRIAPAEGAFYLYANISGHPKFAGDSLEFCRAMLQETGVCIVPGIDFDKKRGQQFVRLSYAGGLEDIHDACNRLQRWGG